MKTVTRNIVAVLLLALLGAACGTAEATGPPEINYGRDICVQCGMIISEERYAAAYRLADGTEKTFDDIGGLLLHQRSTGAELDATTTWVHDYQTEEWAEVDRAFFVPTRSVSSPMGHGIVSFADKGRADAFATDVGGEVVGWSVVLELPNVDGLVGHHHMEDNNRTDDMNEMEDTDSGESAGHEHDG